MKTVSRNSSVSLARTLNTAYAAPQQSGRIATGLLAVLLLLAPVSSRAADMAPMAAPVPGSAIVAAPAPAPVPVSAAGLRADGTPTIISPAPSPALISPVAAIADTPAVSDDREEKSEKGSKGLMNAEAKVTEAAKSLVRRLNTTDSVTLDDLNAARQTVVKIDALIEIEKRLNELAKLRADRDDKSTLEAMPASALSPLPLHNQVSKAPPAVVTSAMPVSMPAPAPSTNLEVSRIIGGNGQFSAVIKNPDGSTRTVERGDHLPDGTVVAINSSGIELDHNGMRRLVHVKNVQTVFSYSP